MVGPEIHFLELYFIEAKQIKGEDCGNVMFGRPEKFSEELNTQNSTMLQSLSLMIKNKSFLLEIILEDGKVGKSDDGIIKLKVFTADIKDKTDYRGMSQWENLKGLPFNSDEYSVAHPSLSQ